MHFWKIGQKKVNYLKRAISILGLIITFYVLYFFQINFFNWFNIAGVKPNLFIVLILFIGLFIGRNVAIPFGFICGIYLDLLTGKQIGISAILFATIGYVAEFLDKNFSKESKITILLMVAGTTILFETIVYIYNCARNLIPLQLYGFVKILLIELLFNVLLTIIIYPLIKKTGFILENIFKKKETITRFF